MSDRHIFHAPRGDPSQAVWALLMGIPVAVTPEVEAEMARYSTPVGLVEAQPAARPQTAPPRPTRRPPLPVAQRRIIAARQPCDAAGVAAAVEAHAASLSIAAGGCSALGLLTASGTQGHHAAISASATSAITRALNARPHPAVDSRGLSALKRLSDGATTASMRRDVGVGGGGAAAVASALARVAGASGPRRGAPQALHALRALTAFLQIEDSDSVAVAFIAAKGAPALMGALTAAGACDPSYTPGVGVALAGCHALSELVRLNNPSIVRAAMDASAVEGVVGMLLARGEHAGAAEVGCAVMGDLLRAGTAECARRVVAAAGDVQCVRALGVHSHGSSGAVDAAGYALLKLATVDEAQATRLAATDAPAVTVGAINAQLGALGSQAAVKWSCKLLAALARCANDDTGATRVAASGGLKAVVDAMAAQPSDPDVVIAGCATIGAVAPRSEALMEAVVAAGGAGAVVRALSALGLRDHTVALAGLEALHCMLRGGAAAQWGALPTRPWHSTAGCSAAVTVAAEGGLRAVTSVVAAHASHAGVVKGGMLALQRLMEADGTLTGAAGAGGGRHYDGAIARASVAAQVPACVVGALTSFLPSTQRSASGVKAVAVGACNALTAMARLPAMAAALRSAAPLPAVVRALAACTTGDQAASASLAVAELVKQGVVKPDAVEVGVAAAAAYAALDAHPGHPLVQEAMGVLEETIPRAARA